MRRRTGTVPGSDMTDEQKAEATIRAQALLDEGWYQISRAHCTLAHLPEGKTGVEALIDAGGQRPDHADWATSMGEAHAGDFFLRCHAGRDGLWLELDTFTFNEWRRLGGETYMSKHWKMRLTEHESRELLREALAWQAQGARSKWSAGPSQRLWDTVEKLKERHAHAIEGGHI